MTNNFRTALKTAKGLGAAKSGSAHWWHQRLTAIIMVLLSVWLLLFIKFSANQSLSNFINMLQKPYNIAPLIALIIVTFYHSALGIRVIIEDYISSIGVRFILIIAMQFFCLVTVICLIVSLLYTMML